MNTQDLVTIILGAIIIPAYIFYLFLKKKELDEENEEIQMSRKILSALKEYAQQQPDFAKILNKFGLL
jgi:hypothetical protein